MSRTPVQKCLSTFLVILQNIFLCISVILQSLPDALLLKTFLLPKILQSQGTGTSLYLDKICKFIYLQKHVN
jgi:hypothetical protein